MASALNFETSVVDLEDEIDNDVQALETAQRSNFTEDTDFVNLDQLGNTIATSKSCEDRKYAIDDILNQTIKHSKALECIDECIKLVITTWKIQQLKQKQTQDLYKLLQQQKHKTTIWQDIITYFYDKPSYICEKIIQIAKRISAMKLLLDHQNMVQLPSTPRQWSLLLNRLKQKGQSLAFTQRILTIPESPPADNDTTELKRDDPPKYLDVNEEVRMFGHVAIDDTVNGVTADDALQDILLKHRQTFTSTSLYKQMTGRSHNRHSSLVQTLLKGVKVKSKSPGNTSTSMTVEHILEDTEAVPASIAIELKPLTGSGSGSDSDDDEHKISQRHSVSSGQEQLFNTDANQESLHKKWKNPTCAGCGGVIQISFDGKDAATKTVLIYDCRFVEDLDSMSSFIYFHDKHCENLRKYKESIRKYVLESQLPSASRGRANNMKNYVKNLLNHKDLLINIDSGALSRPGKILEREQAKFLSFITGGLLKLKSAEKLEEKMSASIMDGLEKKEEKKLTLLEISKQRDIAVRFLTRGEIVQQTFHDFHQFMEAEVAEREESHGIFDDIPKILQYADSHIFGEPLFKFVIQQLLSKQTTALWRLLAYISMQLPTVHSISLLNEHQSDLAKVKKMAHLQLVCTSIIQAAAYPIGTALHLSGFMSDLAENDLSREDNFRAVATRYINIAEILVEDIESDHLLALLLEVPTDIDQMNVFDIAIQFGLDDFFDNNRVDRVITHMHQQFDFLNPNKIFSTCEMSTYRLLRYMIESPSKFYYSPIGKWWTSAILYILYVLIVTIVCSQQNYLYTEITGIEYIMWIANAGYITYEVTEMLLASFEYFSETSNMFDSIISVNWLLLAFLRLLAPHILPEKLIYGSSELDSRNKTLNVIYMFLFGVEMCLLYLRFATILTRSRTLGPFIRMIINMISDILNFSLIVLLLLAGFIFALSFVIGGDKDPSIEYCYDEDKDHSKVPLSTLPSIALYAFQVLLGQQEWPVIAANECLSPNRSRVVQLYIIILSILGTVLLLNLLIAMMASTYENQRQSTSKDVNFSRTEETYQLAHRNALIAAPFNIVAYAMSLFVELITIIVIICTGGKYVFDILSMVPVGINYTFKHTQNKNRENSGKIKKKCSKIAQCCCTFIRKVSDLSGDDAPASYVKNVYFNYGDGGRRFCRYCREYIGERNGDISDYFDLFITYRLDEEDVKLMRRIMRGSGVCPTCYRPYKTFDDGTTDRLQRWEIQIEVISYYVFRIFVHIPMILILLLPALVGGLASWITSIAKDSHKITSDAVDDKDIQNIITTDECYRNLVQNVIQNEMQQNMDVLSTQIESLNKKFISISNQQKKYNSQLTNITNLLTSIDNKLADNTESKQESKSQQKRKELGGILQSEFHSGTTTI